VLYGDPGKLAGHTAIDRKILLLALGVIVTVITVIRWHRRRRNTCQE